MFTQGISSQQFSSYPNGLGDLDLYIGTEDRISPDVENPDNALSVSDSKSGSNHIECLPDDSLPEILPALSASCHYESAMNKVINAQSSSHVDEQNAVMAYDPIVTAFVCSDDYNSDQLLNNQIAQSLSKLEDLNPQHTALPAWNVSTGFEIEAEISSDINSSSVRNNIANNITQLNFKRESEKKTKQQTKKQKIREVNPIIKETCERIRRDCQMEKKSNGKKK